MKASNDQYSRGPDGEARLKFYAVKIFPHSVHEENQMLLKRMNVYKDKHVERMMEWFIFIKVID